MIIPPSHNAIRERLRADDAELSFRTPNNKNFLNNVLGKILPLACNFSAYLLVGTATLS